MQVIITYVHGVMKKFTRSKLFAPVLLRILCERVNAKDFSSALFLRQFLRAHREQVKGKQLTVHKF